MFVEEGESLPKKVSTFFFQEENSPVKVTSLKFLSITPEQITLNLLRKLEPCKYNS